MRPVILVTLLTLSAAPAQAAMKEACGEYRVGTLAFVWRDADGFAANEAVEIVRKDIQPMERGQVFRACTGDLVIVQRLSPAPGPMLSLFAEDLALASAASARDGAVLLLGLERGRFEARAVREGRTVATVALGPTLTSMGADLPAYGAFLDSLEDKGFAGAPFVAVARFEYAACGYAQPAIPVIWDGRGFTVGPEAVSVFEAGVFHVTARLLFPWDAGGARQAVVVQVTTSSFDEALEGYRDERVERETWDLVDGRFAKRE